MLTRRRHAAALGHADDLAFLGVLGHLRDRHRGRRLDLGELDAVEVGRPALAEVVGDAQDVFAVGREGEAEIAVRAAGVVVADEARRR